MQAPVITFRKFTASVCFFLCLFSIKSLSFSFIPIIRTTRSDRARTRATPHYTTNLAMSTSSRNPNSGDAVLSSSAAAFRPTVSLTGAATQKALLAAEQYAATKGWKVTIAIADAGGTPLLVKRCDGAFAASYTISVEKAKTAALFCKNTGELEAAVNNINTVTSNTSDNGSVDGGSSIMTSRAALLSTHFCLMRGGVPIMVNGICCGAIGVSGVKPDQDEQIAIAAVNALNSMISKL
jgi:glc operon protein GlcG